MAGPDEHGRWRLEIRKDKLRHSISTRFFVRFHISLILLLSIFCGWSADMLLLTAGLTTMAVRYVLAVCAAYGGFLLGVYIWIEYSGIREYLNRRKAELLVGDDVPQKPEFQISKVEELALLDPTGCLIGGEGCLTVVAVFFALVILFFFFGGYLWLNAASFFTEIVLELLLAAGLMRGFNRVESSGWVIGTISATWWSLMFTLATTLLFCFVAHVATPNAKTLPEVIQQWHKK